MPDNPKPNGASRGIIQAESMIQLAFAVPVGCFVGLGLGTLLDRHFHLHWLGFIGIFLGAAAGFVQIFTTASRMARQDRRSGPE